MQPDYFVKHPDDTYSLADPQPVFRAEWDPAPNAGCQQGHPLIEFHSTGEARDCPLCAAKKELDDEITARVVAEVNEKSAHAQRAEALNRCNALEGVTKEALGAFKCSQRVIDYPEAHWSRRACALLNEDAKQPGYISFARP